LNDSSQKKAARLLGAKWQISLATGWGLLGWNLAIEAARDRRFGVVPLFPPINTDVVPPAQRALMQQLSAREKAAAQTLAKHPIGPVRFNFPMLHSCSNGLFQPPAMERIVGTVNFMVVFLTDTNVAPETKAKAKEFSLLLAGSNWNTRFLRENGIANVETFLQGVDLSLFQPKRRVGQIKDKFLIFSGGKLEFRKGQDIVVAAFRKFQKRRSNAVLVTAWQNAWPKSIVGIERKGHVQGIPVETEKKELDMVGWLEANGVARTACHDVGLVPNQKLPELYAKMDVAVFPNRSEGGTNLVAMECMASGVPTILSANTGHLDLIDERWCYPLTKQTAPPAEPRVVGMEGWGESDVDELVELLERVYSDRAESEAKGAEAARFMQSWSWEARFKELMGHLQRFNAL
jgi:glycosyltransferase involved in cell wall biosynthesis